MPELCLAAVDGGAVVGHVAFSRALVGARHAVLTLAPLAVLPERQRQGIGSALVADALRRARGTDFPLVVVVGHPAYYPRFGFEPATPLGLICPYEVPTEGWMAYRLPAYRPDVRGVVAFAAALASATG